VASADRVAGDELGKVFRFDPDKGVWVASVGPQGSGKSDFCLRIFEGYPYDGILIDNNADADPHNAFTEDLPSGHARSVSLPNGREATTHVPFDWPEMPSDGPRFRKFRYTPDYLDDHWLTSVDEVVGLAYRHGLTIVQYDEAADDLPAAKLGRWSRLSLRMGRHRKLSQLFPMPRPLGDPLTLSQSHLVTIHGPLHEIDVNRIARHLHMKDAELSACIDALDIDQHEFLAWNRAERELLHCDGLPPRRHAPV
jgi:hypothetical protein